MVLKDSSPLLRRLAVLSTFKSPVLHTTLHPSPAELARVWKWLGQFLSKFLELFCVRDCTTARTNSQGTS